MELHPPSPPPVAAPRVRRRGVRRRVSTDGSRDGSANRDGDMEAERGNRMDTGLPPEQQQGGKEKKRGAFGSFFGLRSASAAPGQVAPANGSGERSSRKKGEHGGKEKEGVITNKIGWLCAHPLTTADWTYVLSVCDSISHSEASAKEAARALRKEFKYGQGETRERAARIWGITTLNTSDRFRLQVASRRFLDVVDDTIASSKTDPATRAILLDVLAVLAWQFKSDGDLCSITKLWNKIKPADRPEDGEPLDPNSPLFSPIPRQPRTTQMLFRTASSNGPRGPFVGHGVWTPAPLTAPIAYPAVGRGPLIQEQIVSPEDDMRKLHEECQIARSNAALLGQALGFGAGDGQVANGDRDEALIAEFRTKVQLSQTFILAQIPWATAQADRSRERADAEVAAMLSRDPNAPTPPGITETPEERLLADLLGANEELHASLQMLADVQRMREFEATEGEVRERSKVEVKVDRSALWQDPETGELFNSSALGGGGGAASAAMQASGSGSRAASPKPSQQKPDRSGSEGRKGSVKEAPPLPVQPPYPTHGEFLTVSPAASVKTHSRQSSSSREHPHGPRPERTNGVNGHGNGGTGRELPAKLQTNPFAPAMVGHAASAPPSAVQAMSSNPFTGRNSPPSAAKKAHKRQSREALRWSKEFFGHSHKPFEAEEMRGGNDSNAEQIVSRRGSGGKIGSFTPSSSRRGSVSTSSRPSVSNNNPYTSLQQTAPAPATTTTTPQFTVALGPSPTSTPDDSRLPSLVSASAPSFTRPLPTPLAVGQTGNAPTLPPSILGLPTQPESPIQIHMDLLMAMGRPNGVVAAALDHTKGQWEDGRGTRNDEEDDDDSSVPTTPVVPSEKALGKRRAVSVRGGDSFSAASSDALSSRLDGSDFEPVHQRYGHTAAVQAGFGEARKGRPGTPNIPAKVPNAV